MRWPHFLAASGLRQGVKSVALALLIAGITSSAVKVFGWKWPGAPARQVLPHAKPHPFDLAHDQLLVPVSPEREMTDPPREPTVSQLPRRNLSASELFLAAKQARTQGLVLEAIRISKQIEEFFPNSEEGIESHLSLGVLYLAQGRSELALQEFALYRRVGSPESKAEAYFGQAQALRNLSRLEDERIVLEELLQSYPRSAYVAAARTRLKELAPDAAGH